MKASTGRLATKKHSLAGLFASMSRNLTIKRKLTLLVMLACIVSLLIAGATFAAYEWVALRQFMVWSLSAQTQIIADNCKAAVAFNDVEDAKETLSSLRVHSAIVFGGIYDKSGKLMASYYRYGQDKQVQPVQLKEKGHVFAENFLTVYERVILDGEVIGTACVRSDLGPLYSMLSSSVKIVFAIIFIGLAAAYFISSRLQRVVSKPILDLADLAKAVSEQRDYAVRGTKISNDEIGFLIDAFNQMLEQIQVRDVALVNANKQLEAKVAERTADLEATIQKRKKVEQALRQSDQRFKQVADTAVEWLWEVNSDGLYTYASPVVERLFGYKPGELVGKKHFYDLFVPGCRQELKLAAFEVFAKKRILRNFENPNVHKDGRVVWVATNGLPMFDENGNLIGYRGSDIDITARKEVEAALKEANSDLEEAVRKLEETNNELKNFAYIASHDLREPLRKISAFGGLLGTSLKGKLNDDDKENLELMIDGADRMQQMIEALLTYSRVTTRGAEFQTVDLNAVVEDLCKFELAVKIEESRAKIVVPERLHNIKGDPTQIRQLMQNLIANGLKYQKKGAIPQITIRSSDVDSDTVRAEVTDNGIGIKEAHFKSLFVMFKRLHSRQEYDGTGIGLAVCKKIVERHGGNIGVNSTYGEGSTFWFTVPTAGKVEQTKVATTDL